MGLFAELLPSLIDGAPLIVVFIAVYVATHFTFSRYIRSLTEQHNKTLEIMQKTFDDSLRLILESKDKGMFDKRDD